MSRMLSTRLLRGLIAADLDIRSTHFNVILLESEVISTLVHHVMAEQNPGSCASAVNDPGK